MITIAATALINTLTTTARHTITSADIDSVFVGFPTVAHDLRMFIERVLVTYQPDAAELASLAPVARLIVQDLDTEFDACEYCGTACVVAIAGVIAMCDLPQEQSVLLALQAGLVPLRLARAMICLSQVPTPESGTLPWNTLVYLRSARASRHSPFIMLAEMLLCAHLAAELAKVGRRQLWTDAIQCQSTGSSHAAELSLVVRLVQASFAGLQSDINAIVLRQKGAPPEFDI